MLTDVIFKGTNSKLFGKYYKSNNDIMPIVLILYPETKNDNIPQAVNAVCDILKENEFSTYIIYKGETYSKELFYLKIIEFLFLKIEQWKNNCLKRRRIIRCYISFKLDS